MDRSNVINLVKDSYQTDSIGQRVSTKTKRTVFCNLRSVTRSEWATAGQQGLNAALVATMFAWDYQGETEVEIQTALVSTDPEQLIDENLKALYDLNRLILMAAGNDIDGSVVRFGVYRTYLAANETIELYLERKAGVTNNV